MLKSLTMLASLSLLAFSFTGCATGPDGKLDPVQTTYNVGSTEADILQFADSLPVVPGKLCGPIRALSDAYFGVEKIVADPNFDPKNIGQDVLNHLTDLMTTAVTVALDLGFSLLAHKPKYGLTQNDWDDLNKRINSGLGGIHCA